MTIKEKNITKTITFFLFLIFFLIGIFTYKDYGISIDEEAHRQIGFYWLNQLLSFTPFEELNNSVALKLKQIKGFTIAFSSIYGVTFDLPLAFLEVIFKINDPKEYFYLRHLLNFLLFFISAIFFYKLLLDRFLNYNIALIGTLFFVLSPRIYGHSFFNNKDLVFLSLVTIALYYCFKSLEKITYKNLLIFSIFSAICTSSRIIGLFLPIFFIIFYILSLLSKKKDIKNLSQIIFFCVSYYLFLIIFWPTLWTSPVDNLLIAFDYFRHMGGNFPVKVFFNGEFYNPNFIPYSYIFTWILITTPILYIILFIIGYTQIFKRFFLKFINIKSDAPYYDLWRGVNEKKDLFILFSITAIVLYWVTFNVLLYTGWRQLYFINVFLIYIATYAFFQINISFKSKVKRQIKFGIIIIFLIFVVYKMTIYHPYQNLYFGSFFNKNAHSKFEIDYWGLSGKKFLEYILFLEKNNNLVKIGVASYLPLERSAKLLNEKDRAKILLTGQNYQEADYLFKNFISEVDINADDKYKIPSNFTKIDEFILDNIRIYEVYKKIN